MPAVVPAIVGERRDLVAAIRLDGPPVRSLVVDGAFHSRVELHVLAQVEAIRDMIGVAQDFRLGGVLLCPLPFLLQLLRELIRVLQARDIAAGAGVQVQDVTAVLHPRGEPQLPQRSAVARGLERSGRIVTSAAYRQSGALVETALRQADMAMYWAKAEGRGRYRFFDHSLDESPLLVGLLRIGLGRHG